MDTWSIARMTLDVIFAVLIATTIAAFLYYREKKLHARLADAVARSLELTRAAASQLASVAEEPPKPQPLRRAAVPESAPVSAVRPSRLDRVEKYLEAVRQHRQGVDRREIEKNLGISFMELELLGRIK